MLNATIPLFIPAGPELLIVLAIVLLLFGGRKLPELARSVGEATVEFREGREKSGQETEEELDEGADSAETATN